MCDAVNATGNAHATKPAATNTGHVHRPALVGVTSAKISATKKQSTASQSQKAVMPPGYGAGAGAAMLCVTRLVGVAQTRAACGEQVRAAP